MDDTERENWERVKLALEAAGKTDTMYYRRAVMTVWPGNHGAPDWVGSMR